MIWITKEDVMIHLDKVESIEIDRSEDKIYFIYTKNPKTVCDYIKFRSIDEADKAYSQIKFAIEGGTTNLIRL